MASCRADVLCLSRPQFAAAFRPPRPPASAGHSLCRNSSRLPQSWIIAGRSSRSRGSSAQAPNASASLDAGYGDTGDGGGRSDGGSGKGGGGDEGSDSFGDNEEDGNDDDILSLSQAEEMAAAKGVELPSDFVSSARASGLRLSVLDTYIGLQATSIAGWFSRVFPQLRDRLIADPRFLFKILVEVAIDVGCCTVAEVRKRGDKFWDEWEFFLSDLIVGIIMDILLVTLMAPAAIHSKVPKAMKQTGVKGWLGRLPTAVFAASRPGMPSFSLADRVACFFVKFVEYGSAGLIGGLLGQGMANTLLLTKKKLQGTKEGEDEVEVPPLMKTALVWGIFMGLSSNVRYQGVYGIERLTELTFASRSPQLANAVTILIRFVNNIVGGENFIDHARYFGVQ